MNPENVLGLDHENGHVNNRGLYHKHALSPYFKKSLTMSLVGSSADGFEIHYFAQNFKSSWQLKKGVRSSPPGGNYDGTYNQDYEHVVDFGDLDKCNGIILEGRYIYIATDEYPFFLRCFRGAVPHQFLR